MAAPLKPLTIGAKHAYILVGTSVIFRNLSRSGKVVVEGSGGEAVGVGPGWENTDKISIEFYGKYNVSAMVTATKGGANTTFGTLSEDTSTPAINL